jgi:very-short-patch-repair endonuclease
MSSLGCHWKLSNETRKKMSLARKGKSRPNFANRSHSNETKSLMSLNRQGTNNSFYGKIHSSETKLKISEKLKNRVPWNKGKTLQYKRVISKEHYEKLFLGWLKSQATYSNTSIELKTKEWLSIHKVNFCYQAFIGKFSIDFYIKKLKLCIFVDGDYWHANPSLYDKNKIMYNGLLASQIWERDSFVTNNLINKGYKVIRIWENEINSNDFSKLESIL